MGVSKAHSNNLNQFSSYAHTFKLYKRISEQYNDHAILESVKELVPSKVLKLVPDDQSLKPLLHWFKNDFMKWMPKELECTRCNDRPMRVQLIDENSTTLRKTEIHMCDACGSKQIFPRYDEILRIAETRIGRCTEWSLLFGGIVNSLSIQTRIVHDYLDHCWNEALINNKWVHIDSTLDYPISFNHPYYYEQNWGKKYEYVLAFSANSLEDVTTRYTQQWLMVQKRRGKKDKVEEFKEIYYRT
ncbi:MAG TPA: transglutaminase domain-containing protein [Nitrososphaeraceae archaeon]|nr:transglutaminase domain-containing protein [Nitrososphaeraceae archaeon]